MSYLFGNAYSDGGGNVSLASKGVGSVVISAGQRSYVYVTSQSAPTAASVGDGGTNTYTQIGSSFTDAGGDTCSYWECQNPTPGTYTVTFNLGGNSSLFIGVHVWTASGLTGPSQFVHQNNTAVGTGADAVTSGLTGTLPSAPGVLFGHVYSTVAHANTVNAGTGFTSRDTFNTEGVANDSFSRLQDKQLSATTSVGATFTLTVGTDNVSASAIWAALAPDGVPPPMPAARALRSASGALAMRLTAPAPAPLGGAIASSTGTAALVQQLNQIVAAGNVDIAGTAAPTQQLNTIAATATNAITGTAAPTQQLNVIAAAGAVAETGSGTLVQQLNTIAAAGTVAITGTAALTQQLNTISAAGANAIAGTAALAQALQAIVGAGNVDITGTAAPTQQLNVIAATATNLISGTAALTETKDAIAAAGTVLVSGSAAIAPAVDLINASGTVISGTVGSAALVAAKDSIVAAGTVGITGTAALAQQLNVISATGTGAPSTGGNSNPFITWKRRARRG